jgi:hypothetical protein
MARQFWAADCETDPFLHGRIPEPFIFGAMCGDEYHEFSTASEFVTFFYEKDVIIYAHNGGKFDWYFILDDLEPGIKIQVINGRLAKFKIGKAEFRDSYNLFPFPLAEYKKDEVDYKIFEKSERNKPKNRDTIRKYLRSDCANLYELLAAFFAEYGSKLTLPGAALAQWKKISGEEPDHSTERFFREMSEYYFGGRVECFKTGVKNAKFSVYDINSAYPRAMCDFHPWGTSCFVDNRLPKGDAAISRSFIKLESKSTGAFPFKPEKLGGLEFPSDGTTRTFKISGWEFLAARDTGTLDATTRILEVRQFADRINFKSYVDHFYQRKKKAKEDGKRGEELFAKYLLNGLYGKFGSNPENYSEYLTCWPDEMEARYEESKCETQCGEKACRARCGKAFKFVTQLHNVAVVSRPLPEPSRRYFNVAVAASITGYVRAHMWRAICSGKGTALYCDTDSLAYSGPFGGTVSGELGDWKNEGAFVKYAIAGKKMYAFYPVKNGTPKIASKGIRFQKDKSDREIRKAAGMIEKIALGAEIEYKQDAPTFGLRGKNFTVRKVKKTT